MGAALTQVDEKPHAPAMRRILVVEDNLDSVHSMARLLKMMGHHVDYAINGFAALDVARRFRPEVILLDIGLPDFSGCQIAEQLKSEPEFARTRFIAITGIPSRDVQQEALDAGCERVLAKPVDPVMLENLLNGESQGDQESKARTA